MDLRTQLATRFHIENIRELLHYIKEDERLREEIYRLIFDEDDVVSIRHCGFVRTSQSLK